MNALIVSEPGEGGVFAYVESLCHYLIGQGITVHLGYSDRRASERLAALVRHVESNGGLTANMGVGSGAGLRDIRAFFRLWRLALRARPDVVHCHSSKAGVLGRSLALVGIRACYFYHPHAYYGLRPARRAIDAVYEAIEALFGRIGTTIVISSDERRFALERLHIASGRVVFIPNGVDTGRFAPASLEQKLALREAFGLPRHGVVLGAMARLSAQKDPVTLYRAFASACSGRPDLHLVHVGTGELEPEVDQLIAILGIGHRVTRLRYLGDPTGFYRAVDGFILTSTYEGMSLAALEAMSSDLPLILSRAPGNFDLLELPLSQAWSAAPGDPEEFERGIGLWHASHFSRLPPNHRSVAMERFDSGKAQAAVLAEYRDAVGAAGTMGAWSARLPVLVWLLCIVCESTDRFSRANTRRMLYPSFHAITGVTYENFFEWNVILRKAGHVVAYGVGSLLLGRLARYETRRDRPSEWSLSCAAIALLGTALVAALDEWHQTTIPSRTGTVADVVLDTCAGLAAQILVFLTWAPIRPRARSSEKRAALPLDRDPCDPRDQDGLEGQPNPQERG